MEQVAVSAFFTEGADEVLDKKIFRYADSEDFEQDLVRHITK